MTTHRDDFRGGDRIPMPLRSALSLGRKPTTPIVVHCRFTSSGVLSRAAQEDEPDKPNGVNFLNLSEITPNWQAASHACLTLTLSAIYTQESWPLWPEVSGNAALCYSQRSVNGAQHSGAKLKSSLESERSTARVSNGSRFGAGRQLKSTINGLRAGQRCNLHPSSFALVSRRCGELRLNRTR